MSLPEDFDTIRALFSQLSGFDPIQRLRDLEPGPAHADAALRILRAVFTERPPPRIDAAANATVDIAAMVLYVVGGRVDELWETVVMRVSHPALYARLVPLLKTILDDDDARFHALLLGELDSDEPRRTTLALRLLRTAYGVRFGFHLTPEQAQALDDAVRILVALGTNDEALASALREYVRPAAR